MVIPIISNILKRTNCVIEKTGENEEELFLCLLILSYFPSDLSLKGRKSGETKRK